MRSQNGPDLVKKGVGHRDAKDIPEGKTRCQQWKKTALDTKERPQQRPAS